jgi:NifU-like protein involved in Fe-S cluster formation
MNYAEILARQDCLRFRQEIVDVDFVGENDNPFCGDSIRIAGRLDPTGNVIAIGFTGYACAICEVASDLLCEYALGRSCTELSDLAPDFTEQLLGTRVPLARKRCASLPLEILQAALRLQQNHSAFQ